MKTSLQCCGTCAYYHPEEDGRHMFGSCTWQIPWPEKWPDSHRLRGGLDQPMYPIVMPVRAIDGRKCETWEPYDADALRGADDAFHSGLVETVAEHMTKDPECSCYVCQCVRGGLSERFSGQDDA